MTFKFNKVFGWTKYPKSDHEEFDEEYWGDDLEVVPTDDEFEIEFNKKIDVDDYNIGYREGYIEGMKDGHQEGYAEGFRNGCDNSECGPLISDLIHDLIDRKEYSMAVWLTNELEMID
jgi:flagellar biosynthesis/type III secretory pathway protein FliH